MTRSAKDEVSVVSYLPTDTNNTFKYASGFVQVEKLDPSIPNVGELVSTQFSDPSLGGPANDTSYIFAKSWSGSFSLSGALGSNVFGINIPFTTIANYTPGWETNFGNTTEHVYRFYTGASGEYDFLNVNGACRTSDPAGRCYYYS